MARKNYPRSSLHDWSNLKANKIINYNFRFFFYKCWILQVILGRGLDLEGNVLPKLIYISREKRPGYDHYKKAGAMNALVRASAVLSNAPFILNLDCDHYINNSKALREAMCFHMDSQLGNKLCFVQFPQRFYGVDTGDRYANHNNVFFDVSEKILCFDYQSHF